MTPIALVTALRLESRAVLGALANPRRVRPSALPTWIGRAGAGEVVVVQGGVGPDAARMAAIALPTDAALIGSIGVVGALVPELEPGDVVVPDTIVWAGERDAERYAVAPDLIASMLEALRPALPRAPRTGAMLSSPAVVAGVDAKRSAYDRHAAIAVEMEAAALAKHAARRGIPLFALRAVLDPADLSLEQLPPNLETSWTARARLATMPAVWPLLGALRRHAATAATSLTAALRVVLPALTALDQVRLPAAETDHIVPA